MHVATRQVHTFGRLSADIMATSSNKLAGKWCIVTGGGAGIGQAIAETFAAEGGSIALVARSKDKLEEVLPVCSMVAWRVSHLPGQAIIASMYRWPKVAKAKALLK